VAAGLACFCSIYFAKARSFCRLLAEQSYYFIIRGCCEHVVSAAQNEHSEIYFLKKGV